jgi:hypothetical protein
MHPRLGIESERPGDDVVSAQIRPAGQIEKAAQLFPDFQPAAFLTRRHHFFLSEC